MEKTEVLPKGWKSTTLGELGRYLNGRGFKRAEWSDKGLPIIRIQNLTGSGSEFNYYNGEIEDRHVVNKGDLLVSWAATLDAFIWDGPKAAVNQHIFKVESFIDRKFHFYLIKEILDELLRQTHGSGMVHVTRSVFDNVPVAIPDEKEQRRIVSAIETQLGRLDAAVARLQQAKAQLKRYKQAVLKAAFSEGEATRLEELCEFITKGTTPTKDMLSANGTVPFIKVYNLTRDGSLDFTVNPTFIDQTVHEKFLARSVVRPGDLLMNIVGPPLGKVSLVPDEYPEWNINQAIVRYRTKERLRTKYLMYYLLCDSTAQELMITTKATAGQYNLTLAHCRDLEVPLISVDKQDFVIAELEDRLGVIDEMETTVDAQLVHSTRLRQSVLKRAFEGRLVERTI